MSLSKLCAGIAAALVISTVALASELPGHPVAAAHPGAPHRSNELPPHRSNELPPLPAMHPTVTEPAVSAATSTGASAAPEAPAERDAAPTRAATRGRKRVSSGDQLGGSVTKARAL